ncbi:MAG: hypothetical protein MSG64_04795 [Pyrinomonadaceae bacterium MAG19_C2-C3]|nr:hypothetical protein [Pyrinomonadaceae bacterium MAG19_C2-C3]
MKTQQLLFAQASTKNIASRSSLIVHHYPSLATRIVSPASLTSDLAWTKSLFRWSAWSAFGTMPLSHRMLLV